MTYFAETLVFQWIAMILFSIAAIINSLLFSIHAIVILHQIEVLTFCNRPNYGNTNNNAIVAKNDTKTNTSVGGDIESADQSQPNKSRPKKSDSRMHLKASPQSNVLNDNSPISSVGNEVQSDIAAQWRSQKWISTQASTRSLKATPNSKIQIHFHLTAFGTLASIALFSVYLFLGVFVKLSTFEPTVLELHRCGVAIKSGTVCYAISKGLMYAVMVIRLKAGFGKSAYGYSKITINALMALICCGTIVFVLAAIWAGKAEVSSIGDHFVCNANVTQLGVFGFVCYDVLFTVLLLYLFIKPLKQLHQTMARNSIAALSAKTPNRNQSKDSRLKHLAEKYAIVVGVALSTSTISLVLIGVFDTALFGIFDIVTNCVCLLLLSSAYSNLYPTLCCGVIKCYNCVFSDDPIRPETAMQTITK